MSRTALVIATLLSCGAALIGASTAAAGPAAVTQTMATAYNGANPCTGEAFAGTGNLHFQVNENLSTTGVLQSHMNVRLDGVQAMTLSGKKYVAQDTFNWEFVFGSADEETFDVKLHYIRTGEDGNFILGDDFYYYMRTHITANASGTVTAEYVATSDPDDSCK